MRHPDVRFGSASAPAHDGGGWALPGGAVTHNRDEALLVASHLAARLDQAAERAHQVEYAARIAVQPVVVTRTKGVNYRAIYNLV